MLRRLICHLSSSTLEPHLVDKAWYIFVISIQFISWWYDIYNLSVDDTIPLTLLRDVVPYALDLARIEVEWLKIFLYDISLFANHITPMLLHCEC